MTSFRGFTDGLSQRELLETLSAGAVDAFEAAQVTNSYPEGATLFTAGQVPTGMFVLRSGEVELCGHEVGAKSRKVRAGGVLGLRATVSGQPYGLTAITTLPAEVAFVPRENLLSFLRDYPDAAFKVVELLSSHVRDAIEYARSARPVQSHRSKLRHTST